MNDTPRTDEQINGKPCARFAVLAGDSPRDALVPAEFARQLERENNQLRAALALSEATMTEKAWAALKGECCVNPDMAVRCVMVSEEAFRAGMAKVFAERAALLNLLAND